MIRAGFSKVDITCYEPEMVMLGWGQLDNRAKGVALPLHARALVIDDGDGKVALVSADLGLISIALREAVLARVKHLGIGPHQLMLGATHTHSGPSGFSHFMAFNASCFGFSKVVFDALVAGLTKAIEKANGLRVPAELRVGRAEVPVDVPVAFNRSVSAYNRNRDTQPLHQHARAQATHRTTVTLRVDSPAGERLGAVNWFGVHASNIHADTSLIHGDNKGLAAGMFEQAIPSDENGPFVALFFQEAAGDVTPNFRLDERRGITVGVSDDDYESARVNAQHQAHYAELAFDDARSQPVLGAKVRAAVEHVDFSRAYVGRTCTTPPIIGLGMAAGTDEGPGPLHSMQPALVALSQLSLTDPKLPWLSLDHGAEGRFLGSIPTRVGFHFVAPVEPRIAFIKAADDAGYVGGAPWAPSVLPLQVMWLGDLVIGAVPFEPTTVAGRRLRAALGEAGSQVVLTTYANGYGGYAATGEEYQLQRYEGGATYFGQHTLDALINAMVWLSRTGGAPLHSPVFGPKLQILDEAFLLAQRRAGNHGTPKAQRGAGDQPAADPRRPSPSEGPSQAGHHDVPPCPDSA